MGVTLFQSVTLGFPVSSRIFAFGDLEWRELLGTWACSVLWLFNKKAFCSVFFCIGTWSHCNISIVVTLGLSENLNVQVWRSAPVFSQWRKAIPALVGYNSLWVKHGLFKVITPVRQESSYIIQYLSRLASTLERLEWRKELLAELLKYKSQRLELKERVRVRS